MTIDPFGFRGEESHVGLAIFRMARGSGSPSERLTSIALTGLRIWLPP